LTASGQGAGDGSSAVNDILPTDLYVGSPPMTRRPSPRTSCRATPAATRSALRPVAPGLPT